MTEQSATPNISPKTVFDFLHNTLPFTELDEKSLKILAKDCIIDFMPKGTVIFRQGVTDVDYFYVIQKGAIKSYLIDDQGEMLLKDFRGEGEYFGAIPIIQNIKANLNVETVEDTFCFLFPKQNFLKQLDSSPRFSQFFLRKLSEKMVNSAYAELRRQHVEPKAENSMFLFASQIGQCLKGSLHTIAASEPIRLAAQLMAEKRIGSLLVKDPQGEITGIITDKDLRTKVVAAGLDYEAPVERVMSSPVQTIHSHAVCFDALLKMMRQRVHHLAVEKNGVICGMITTHDIMLLQGTSPLYLFREIITQRHLDGLPALAGKIPSVVRSLIEEGAKANNITKMITVLNDHILERMLTLLIEKLGDPPLPFCWLLMGSEGRSEQTFKTDQDNAIIYADPETPEQEKLAEEYFKQLGEQAIEHLVKCGYPLCPGEIMASNPKWRMSAKSWRRHFDSWIRNPEPIEIMHSTIFFDLRGGYGELSLAGELRKHLVKSIPGQDLFLFHLANNALDTRPPLSFFRNLIVEKDGEHRNTMDIKIKGLVSFVDFARIFALRNGFIESNTLGRLQLLEEAGHIPKLLYNDAIKAYEFLMQLRLVHQLHKIEDDEAPDNHINPANLSELEKQTMKEAFEVVRRLQDHIREEFHITGR